ncbi:MAG: hypothetical protein U9R07_14045 [Pseudomonadota bacterium]|nr:hypothetical protein [Pseudomonadota bacterium]
MTIEETLQARLDALLECQPGTDQSMARAALVECAERFGEAALKAMVPAGSLAFAVLVQLSAGMSRQEVGQGMASHLGGPMPN